MVDDGGNYVSDHIDASWSDIDDSVISYQYSLWELHPDETQGIMLVPWTTTTSTSASITIPLQQDVTSVPEGTELYIAVKAQNVAGFSDPGWSDGIKVDNTPPDIEITNPVSQEIHIASDQIEIKFDGTAADTIGIASVYMGSTDIGSDVPPGDAEWQALATYQPGSSPHTWTCDRQITQAQRIWFKATDPAGHSATTYRDVNVVSVIYVDGDNGNDSNDGLSWLSAKQTITNALHTATSGTEIWVAQKVNLDNGQYKENSIPLSSGIALYGGFAGGEAIREQRNWVINTTIIDAQLANPVIIAINVDSTAKIDGFTLANGSYAGGGGIYCYNDSAGYGPTISDNVIRNCSANPDGGGGIYCYGSSPTITRNIITGCSAVYAGAGIDCEYQSWATIRDNVILNNTGSGVYVSCNTDAAGDRPAITNNTIRGNIGPGIDIESGAPIVVNNIVALNSGGIYNNSPDGPVIKYNNIFSNVNDTGSSDYYGWEPDSSNIFADPKFLDDYHIALDSPCIGKGDNSIPQSNETDIDGDTRTIPTGGRIDIGADEVRGCGWHLAVNASPQCCSVNDSTSITATFTDDDGNAITSGPDVSFSLIEGTGTFDSLPSKMGADGKATANLRCTTVGFMIVKVSVSDNSGGADQCTAQGSVRVHFDNQVAGWPTYMGNPQHTGLSPFTDDDPTTTFDPGPAWSESVPTCQETNANYWIHSDSSPVVDHGIVVVGIFGTDQDGGDDSTGGVCAFDAISTTTDAPPIWSTVGKMQMKSVCATPCISGDYVYIATDGHAGLGQVYCLSLMDGSVKWMASMDKGTHASPVVYDGTIYCLDHTGKAYAFHTDTGDPVTGWPVPLAGDTTADSSPAIAVANSTAYLIAGFDSPYLYEINLGNPVLTISPLGIGTDFDSSPTVDSANGCAYIGDSGGGNNLHEVGISQFAQLTGKHIPLNGYEYIRTTAALAYGRLYLGTTQTGGVLYWVSTPDLTVGGLSFAPPVGSSNSNYFNSSPAVTNALGGMNAGIIYVGNENGYLYALNAADLSLLASYNTANITDPPATFSAIHSSPAIAYIPDGSGNVKRWVFVTTRAAGGRLLAFKTD